MSAKNHVDNLIDNLPADPVEAIFTVSKFMMECWDVGEPHGGLTFEEKISVHTVLVELISDADMLQLPLTSLPAVDFANRVQAKTIMLHHAKLAVSASQSALDKRRAETILSVPSALKNAFGWPKSSVILRNDVSPRDRKSNV